MPKTRPAWVAKALKPSWSGLQT